MQVVMLMVATGEDADDGGNDDRDNYGGNDAGDNDGGNDDRWRGCWCQRR